MATPDACLEALKDALAAAMPARLVTRNFRPLSAIPLDELELGVVTLVGLGEHDFANYLGREAQLGKLKGMLLLQFVLTGEDCSGLAVEREELAFAEALKTFLSGPMPAPVTECLANGFRQSGQLEAPNGWVVFELEID